MGQVERLDRSFYYRVVLELAYSGISFGAVGTIAMEIKTKNLIVILKKDII